ncbi:MAG: sugar ABC transporter ATP-binding protein [Proteobacteria bacterium]|nr:sugar ABC transporter ATP-binding protein [Pseudomonadota bacterium]
MDEAALLDLKNISKSFGGVQALENVSISVKKGEVHAIVGENGAGKSTLMKIIAGALLPDSGTIEFEKRIIQFNSPRDAARQGISIVYQEPIYFRELSVIENIYMGDELKNKQGLLDWDLMSKGASEAVKKMGLPVEIIGKTMSDLMLGSQQLVLIARSIHKEAKVLILDEPTAILSQAETELLFKTIREVKKQGGSIIYISHRLEEIFKIADRISVLRDGKNVVEYTLQEASEDKLVMSMTGRNFSFDIEKKPSEKISESILSVKNISRAGFYQNVTFEVKSGEILGFYGLVGAGRSEVVKAVYGEMHPDEGEILYKGEKFSPRNSREAIDRKIVYVPEDRRQQGLFLIREIRDNLSAGLLRSVSNKIGIINPRKELSMAQSQVDRLKIKISSLVAPVSSLSGGNQQKVVLGRGLTHMPELLILDEPTHGIDVGTKSEIHKLITSLAQNNIAIILISSELPEILALADNILVMHEGTMMGYLKRSETNEESILRLALGLSERSKFEN